MSEKEREIFLHEVKVLAESLSDEWLRAGELARKANRSKARAAIVPILVDRGIAEVRYERINHSLVGFYRRKQ